MKKRRLYDTSIKNSLSEYHYHKFRVFINSIVFFALILVFLFVEISKINSKLSFVPIITLSLLFLMMGISTFFPNYFKKEGVTFMLFSAVIALYNLALLLLGYPFEYSMLIEFATAFMLFLYGHNLCNSKKHPFRNVKSIEMDKEFLE